MTPEQFRTIRLKLGYTTREMAMFLGLKAGRTVQRYETGEIVIPGSIIKILEITGNFVKSGK